MKKKIIAGLLLATTVAAVVAGCGLGKDNNESVSDNDADNKTQGVIKEDVDFVTYYGCPNSKRVKRLNLRKQRKSV